MAAAALSLALRRSSRLHRQRTQQRDQDTDQDSSSDDPENELTPRALRALKRQRLALDPDGLPFSHRPRPRKRRKENIPRRPLPPAQCPKRPSSPPLAPLTPNRTQAPDWQASPLPPSPLAHPFHSPHSTATTVLDPIKDPSEQHANDIPELSIPPPSSPSSPSPLTPLTPSPESSPSLPGHDRQPLPSPPHEPLPPPVSIDPLPIPSPPDPAPSVPLPSQPFTSPPPPHPVSLDPALDALIPFDALHPQFDPDLAVQLPSPCQPPSPPQLQPLELQDQFHSFPQQLYVPPNPVFVRDREINIWKLACQERVDCLLRRYGIDYIKALVESQARSLSQGLRSTSSSGTPSLGPAPPSQTKFRLYTPASYTYSSTSWDATSASRKPSPFDDDHDDPDPAWPIDDPEWVDPDVDMEDDDDDDYEDDDDPPEPDTEREGEATLGAVEALVIADTPKLDPPPPVVMQIDHRSEAMQVDRLATSVSPEPPVLPRSVASPLDHTLRPLTPVPHAFPPPLVTALVLPPLSSLHVPLLSEPPRAFMGRGTPPDRQRLSEWSGSTSFATNGMGPPLYLSPVPQRHPNADVGIVPMSVDSPINPPPPHIPPTHGEWTSFLYSMLEADSVGAVGGASHAPEPTWYELGLGSVSTAVPENALALPLHPQVHTRTPAVEQPADDGNNTSSTLRFALG